MFYLLTQFQKACYSCLKFILISSLGFSIFLVLLVNFSFSSGKVLAKEVLDLPTVAITQIVEHVSLDKVRQGLIDELAKQGLVDGKSIRIVYKNAQGNLGLAAQIAAQFAALNPKVMVGIATPSAQTLVNAARAKKLAVVFASVTDPLDAKLVSDLKHPGKNITGTRNLTPLVQEIQLIKQLVPQLKTLGVLLNEGEANSLQLLKMLTVVAKKNGIEIKAAAITSSAELQPALTHLRGKIDALFLLQDNTVASALPLVLQIATKTKLPVFSAYLDAVKAGALAGLAADEYAIGQQTAKLVLAILQGKNPGELAVEDPAEFQLALNLKTAAALGLKFDEELLRKAKRFS